MAPKADRKATTNAKHWCEFCRTFIYNNKISRDKHENSDWHRDSVQRFIDRQQRDEAQRQRLLGKFTAATGVKLGKETVASAPKASFYQKTATEKKGEEPLDLLTMQRKRTISQVDDDIPTIADLQAQTATVGSWNAEPSKPKEASTAPIVTLGPIKSGKGKLSISLRKDH